jgi:hypothetical protein
LGTDLFVHNRIISTVKSVEFVGDSISFRVPRGCWCNIIVLNLHAPSEDKSDDSETVLWGIRVGFLSFS